MSSLRSTKTRVFSCGDVTPTWDSTSDEIPPLQAALEQVKESERQGVSQLEAKVNILVEAQIQLQAAEDEKKKALQKEQPGLVSFPHSNVPSNDFLRSCVTCRFGATQALGRPMTRMLGHHQHTRNSPSIHCTIPLFDFHGLLNQLSHCLFDVMAPPSFTMERSQVEKENHDDIVMGEELREVLN